jgi:hypothetical protein
LSRLKAGIGRRLKAVLRTKNDRHSAAGKTLMSTFTLQSPEGQPLLSADDVVAYDWATHTLTLRPGAREHLRSALVGGLVRGVPFVVMADGAACYRGVFTTSLSSATQSGPVIDLDAGERLTIELGYPSEQFFQGVDPRGDERVRQVLEALGKLR